MHRTRSAFRRQQGRGGILVALTLLAGPAAAQDQRPRTFTLANAGTAAVVAVELSAAGQARYGLSVIGRVELPPGNALFLTLPATTPCLNDLRIRWADGRVEDLAREDLCQPRRTIRLAPATN